jgi:succinate dehydrogenase/fumarate reductase-like Fe-S protein
MSGDVLNLTLRVWRQAGPDAKGGFFDYQLQGVSTHMSFLEMLDVLNEKLVQAGDEPVAFDHDCREGICGMCSLMINGQARVSCICADSVTGIRSRLSRGVPPHFRFYEIWWSIDQRLTG